MTNEPAASANATRSQSTRFVLESDQGLLVNVTAEGGNQLLMWTTREAAERMAPGFVGGGNYRVSEIETGELREELESLRETGMSFVVLDPQPERDGLAMPVEEAIAFYGRLAADAFEERAGGDHLIQRLERLRRADAVVDAEAEAIPLDCPHCHGYFTLPEAAYRAWRDGRAEYVRCPKCQAMFRETEFGRVTCADCRKPSGWMPISLSRGVTRADIPWRCLDCADAAIQQRARASAAPPGRFAIDDWYPIVVGSIAVVALLAGIFIKFFVMGN